MKHLLQIYLFTAAAAIVSCKPTPPSPTETGGATPESMPQTQAQTNAEAPGVLKQEMAKEERKTSTAKPSESTAHYGIGGPRPAAAPKKSKSGAPAARGPIRRPPPPPPGDFNTEGYDHVTENPFKTVEQDPLSTFSIDVDTASYANIRRMLKQGTLPPAGAVRIEEMVNYFSYDYPDPDGPTPFSTNVSVTTCPWNTEHLLTRIGLKGKQVHPVDRQPANLVFLLDVSGSMNSPDKLPLLQRSLKMAVNQLSHQDRVAIVVYAGASGVVLPSTPFTDRPRILEALDRLRAGGSTNAGEGILSAYRIAQDNFIKGGINRVILATDGDFNVGITSQSDMVDLITKMAKQGVFLTVLGLGMGNLKDDMLEKLADKGNGNYAYIDNFQEARKVFSAQMNATLVTIAKDVKIQVEFNPAKISAYRLIGYENRMLNAEDFNDDTKDAGEIGAGHTVTALYEIVPRGAPIDANTPKVDPLKYQQKNGLSENALSSEMMTVKLRYKKPDGDTSQKLDFPVREGTLPFEQASADFRFAAATAMFGMLLKKSKYKGTATFDSAAAIADSARERDPNGYRVEMVQLIKAARDIPESR